MKNKSTLAFYTFLSVCFYNSIVNAQQFENKKSETFDLEIINYSDKPDFNAEHYHLLMLKNNSNKLANYKLSSKDVKCKSDYNNVVRNKKGKIENNEIDANSKTTNKKNVSSLNVETYDENINEKINEISLNLKESKRFYVKITRLNNTEIGQSKCIKITAEQFNKKQEEYFKKSVIIKSFIPDPNSFGH